MLENTFKMVYHGPESAQGSLGNHNIATAKFNITIVNAIVIVCTIEFSYFTDFTRCFIDSMKLLHLGIEEVEILRHGYEVMEKIFGRRFFSPKALEKKIRIMAKMG